jgi:hypothetical protein
VIVPPGPAWTKPVTSACAATVRQLAYCGAATSLKPTWLVNAAGSIGRKRPQQARHQVISEGFIDSSTVFHAS